MSKEWSISPWEWGCVHISRLGRMSKWSAKQSYSWKLFSQITRSLLKLVSEYIQCLTWMPTLPITIRKAIISLSHHFPSFHSFQILWGQILWVSKYHLQLSLSLRPHLILWQSYLVSSISFSGLRLAGSTVFWWILGWEKSISHITERL